MNKDIPVAKINISNGFSKAELTEVYTPDYLPLHALYNQDNPDAVFSHWFWHRCIPAGRDGVEEFLSYTKCRNTNELAVKNRALSITDHYWLKKQGESSIFWDNVNLFQNGYSNEVGNLIFGMAQKKITNICSPDLTTNGWLKKAWRRDNGEDYLFKSGSFPYFQEPLNEVFCSELAKKFCELDIVEYSLRKVNKQLCSVCKNFVTEKQEFVPAFAVYQTEERPFYMEPFDFLVKKCRDFGMMDIRDKISAMMSFDYLISNTDRHMGNFGFMRDIDTLQFMGMAPLFDNGTSLWNDDIAIISSKRTPTTSEPFINWQEEQLQLLKNFDNINIHAVKDMSERLFDLLANAGMDMQKVDEICRKYDEKWEKLNYIIEHHFQKKLFKTRDLDEELIR